MSAVEEITFEDDFDPFAEVDFGQTPPTEDEDRYQSPIPGADQSMVSEPVELSADERIEQVIAGLPGQQSRVLAILRVAQEPTLEKDIVAQVDEMYPHSPSVFDTPRLLALLAEAGAVAPEADSQVTYVEESEGVALAAQNFETDSDGTRYLVVADLASALYVTTEVGQAALERRHNVDALRVILDGEPHYRPIYLRAMSLVADEGAVVNQLKEAIDSDPLCQNPRRYWGYFLNKLEAAGLAEWRQDAWRITDLGAETLAAIALKADSVLED